MGGSYSQQPSSTANRPQPVALKKPTVNNNGGDIVVIPVDASKQAESAFLWYLRHVHKPENEVRVIHCEELHPTSPILSEHTFTTDSWVQLKEKAKAAGADLVKQYEKKLADNNVEGKVMFKIGHPGEIVVNVAEKEGASHIVMGTRGFGLVRRTILGSVSEYVIHHTRIPVTVVPRETSSWFF